MGAVGAVWRVGGGSVEGVWRVGGGWVGGGWGVGGGSGVEAVEGRRGVAQHSACEAASSFLQRATSFRASPASLRLAATSTAVSCSTASIRTSHAYSSHGACHGAMSVRVCWLVCVCDGSTCSVIRSAR